MFTGQTFKGASRLKKPKTMPRLNPREKGVSIMSKDRRYKTNIIDSAAIIVLNSYQIHNKKQLIDALVNYMSAFTRSAIEAYYKNKSFSKIVEMYSSATLSKPTKTKTFSMRINKDIQPQAFERYKEQQKVYRKKTTTMRPKKATLRRKTVAARKPRARRPRIKSAKIPANASKIISQVGKRYGVVITKRPSKKFYNASFAPSFGANYAEYVAYAIDHPVETGIKFRERGRPGPKKLGTRIRAAEEVLMEPEIIEEEY